MLLGVSKPSNFRFAAMALQPYVGFPVYLDFFEGNVSDEHPPEDTLAEFNKLWWEQHRLQTWFGREIEDCLNQFWNGPGRIKEDRKQFHNHYHDNCPQAVSKWGHWIAGLGLCLVAPLWFEKQHISNSHTRHQFAEAFFGWRMTQGPDFFNLQVMPRIVRHTELLDHVGKSSWLDQQVIYAHLENWDSMMRLRALLVERYRQKKALKDWCQQ